jgi:hypothetical protein
LKNKKLKYVLLPLVIIVWGLIFYKVFKQVNDEPAIMESNSITQTNEKDTAVNSNYQLDLGYRDPFKIEVGTINNDLSNVSAPINPQKKIVVWPAIQVKGYILDKKVKPKFWVRLDNASYLIQQGDVVKNVKFSLVKKDSIVFTFDGEKKSFAIKY